MSEVTSSQDELSEVDNLYRRLSTADQGRPGEWVRRKVQAYAAQQAAEREAISSASIERLEARLATIQQTLTDGRAQTESGALPRPGDGQPDS